MPTAQKPQPQKMFAARPLDFTALVLTAHAAERQDERRLLDYQIEFALRWGTRLHRKGATFYHVRRKDQPAWLDERHARRFYGTTLVVSDGVLVTAYRKLEGFHDLKCGPRRGGHADRPAGPSHHAPGAA